MSYVWLAYAVVLAGWAVFEWRDLRRSGFPSWIVMVDGFSLALICVITVMYSVGRPKLLVLPLVFAVIAAVVAIRVYAFRHEEWDIELSPRANRLSDTVALAVALLLLSPAVYLQISSEGRARAGIAATALGGLVGIFAPRLRKWHRWEAERELAEWAASPLEHGGTPDATELLDRRQYKWPGEADPVWVALVRYTIGGESHVGIVGPYVFSFADQSRIAAKPLDDIYEAYAQHYVSEVQD